MKITPQTWKLKRESHVPSAWKGLEDYIFPIIEEFNLKQDVALEFGVDYGYSSHILSQAFSKVVGVDSFIGDIHVCNAQGD